MYSLLSVPGRHIRSAMNDDLEDIMELDVELSANKSNEIPEEDVAEEEYSTNSTINKEHILNKRLDPLVDPNRGHVYEKENYPQEDKLLDSPSTLSKESVSERKSYTTNERRRQNRQRNDNGHLPKVKIHNIISGLPKPEVEMLYSVYRGK